ncbi:hypothetical protein MBLNU230_g1358t2 [Neophaeotheca triangularis]
MSAAEANFPNPPDDQPQWLTLALGVFNSQIPRWNTETCDGGLKWQIFSWNNGYNYKNTISQGCLFNIAARLGAYSGNDTYFDWADKVWEWTHGIGLINDGYQVFDGTDSLTNCTEIEHTEWSYNNGILLHGAAVMWNQTSGDEAAKWRTRMEGLIKRQKVFFAGPNSDIMIEVACERNDPNGASYCNNDQRSFKAYLARWMAATTKLAPWTYDELYPYLQTSAQAAAKACSGGDDGTTCGNKWWTGQFDGFAGPGEQMSALEVIQSLLIQKSEGPKSSKTGGTSEGDVTAGTEGDGDLANQSPPPAEVTTGDKAGAGILTALFCLVTAGGCWWIVS